MRFGRIPRLLRRNPTPRIIKIIAASILRVFSIDLLVTVLVYRILLINLYTYMLCNVNILAWLVASIASLAVGAIWYSPIAFGKQWMALSGIDPIKMQVAGTKDIALRYVAQFIATLVANFILARIIFMVGSNTWAQGAVLAIWIWLGFVAALSTGMVIWENKSKKLWAINAGGSLVALVIAGIIIAAWR